MRYINTFQKKVLEFGNQKALFHNEGYQAGYFHTYNHFHIQGSPSKERKMHVFLPHEYENTNLRYPVLYMNDGHTTFFNGGYANKSWRVADILNNLYIKKEIHKLIVVAIHPINRNAEYTHSQWHGTDCCELPSYCNYITNFVKPFIDRFYRTQPEPEHSMILGASHGGLAAFYIAIQRADKFGFCGSLSPSFWVGIDHAENFPNVELSIHAKLKDSHLINLLMNKLADLRQRPKIYISWGLVRSGGPHNEFMEKVTTIRGREMTRLLQDKFNYQIGKDLLIFEDSDGDHTETAWRRHMPEILKFFVNCAK